MPGRALAWFVGFVGVKNSGSMAAWSSDEMGWDGRDRVPSRSFVLLWLVPLVLCTFWFVVCGEGEQSCKTENGINHDIPVFVVEKAKARQDGKDLIPKFGNVTEKKDREC